MSEYVGILEGADTRADVETIARGVAVLLGTACSSRDVGAPDADSEQRILDILGEPEVEGAVLSGDREDGDLWRILTGTPKPVVVVPPGVHCVTPVIRRVLLPMDGAPDTAEAVAGVVTHLADDTIVTATHVFDPATVPPYWDQAVHAAAAWLDEFAARNLPAGAHLQLHRGKPVTEVLAEAEHCGADLMVLGWKQHAEAGRAPLVHSALAGGVPVLLVAATQDQRQDVRDLRP